MAVSADISRTTWEGRRGKSHAEGCESPPAYNNVSLKRIIMITKANEKAEAYVAMIVRNFEQSIGVRYSDYEQDTMRQFYSWGYRDACREIMELIESSKTPNVKVLLERIKE